ncbi:MAG TPA: type II toxin-antitoxin system HicA family toxin [Candidatus Hydrogenedentes bacterium]|nr:type II toxin-antitoxin system HicA family toxin [Candidatus Hydrogenedentota bacterium]
MTYRELAKRLRELGCVEIERRGSGSHRKWKNPDKDRATVIPDWGAKDLKLGTVRASIRQLGLEWDDFAPR